MRMEVKTLIKNLKMQDRGRKFNRYIQKNKCFYCDGRVAVFKTAKAKQAWLEYGLPAFYPSTA